MTKIKSLNQWFVHVVLTLLVVTGYTQLAALSSLASNDPYPMHSALNPQRYLYTREKLRMVGIPLDVEDKQQVGLSFSAFGQTACIARNQANDSIPLGDLNGRWGMVGLLYGPLPEGKMLPPTLQTAFDNLFPTFEVGTLNDPLFIDPAQNVGFFSVPLLYKKKGIRIQFEALLGRIGRGCVPYTDSSYHSDFGIQFNAGVADICQHLSQTCQTEVIQNADETDTQCCRPKSKCGICDALIPGFHNRTCCMLDVGCSPCGGTCKIFVDDPPVTVANINKYLMCELKNIAPEICLDISKFHEVSPEDIEIFLFWRHAYFINKGRIGWPAFLLMPYIEAGGSIGVGKSRDPNHAFALPFGNNGHHSFGGLAGIDFDFVNSVTFGGEVGATYFLSKKFCNYRVPNSRCQSGIYPFMTDVNIKPGFNWHFGLKMAAYHFYDRLSFYFQYLYIHHEEDEITLCKPDPAFVPEVLENRSCWKSQMINVGFAYDISPNITFGFLWQTPTVQRNAYRPTTLMITFNAEF